MDTQTSSLRNLHITYTLSDTHLGLMWINSSSGGTRNTEETVVWLQDKGWRDSHLWPGVGASSQMTKFESALAWC